ncbi:lysoplasmalogenase family protein [Pararhodobacter oceanensis]|uniref:lysoplasmalogenase family protein n=1 Tax=Pararhodobacter oceanensis TaxID=2172121 RepID=UPI003A908D9F
MQIILGGVAAVAALVYWLRYAGADMPSPAASSVKTLSTAALALLGWWLGAPLLVVIGLAFGSLGDLALSRAGDRAFLAGMLAFALGHLAYVVEFARLLAADGPQVGAVFWLTVAAMLVLVPLTLLWIAPKAGGLAWPVRAYALIIGAMALAASLLPQSSGLWLLQIGVAAFLASDFILALGKFIATHPRTRLLASRGLWPLYWGGQALILWGAVL